MLSILRGRLAWTPVEKGRATSEVEAAVSWVKLTYSRGILALLTERLLLTRCILATKGYYSIMKKS
jgi:hypothetical protein